jgi:hypothetical protein
MSLYQCEKCGGRENTATGSYWGEKVKLCSECKTGEWHGSFPKLLLPKNMFITNNAGNLEHKDTGETDLSKFELKG